MSEKPRIRVKARGMEIQRADAPVATVPSRRATAYLRDSGSNVIAARPAALRLHNDEVRRVWERAGALAIDMVQNSGRLKGACDQMLADVIGNELMLNPQPDLSRLGYSDKERSEFIALVKAWWKRHSWNPAEFDFRGKWTASQQCDIALRYWLAWGESTSLVLYMDEADRRRYGIATGNKLMMVPPHRLVRTTNEFENLYQGVTIDDNGRPASYRFRERVNGIDMDTDYAAHDDRGRPLVIHAFDPMCAEDMRGISPMAPMMRKYLMAENLDDATAQMAFLQTVYAMVLTSKSPSEEAFEALEDMASQKGTLGELGQDYLNYFKARMDRAADSKISVGSAPTVSHLAPDEDLAFKTAGVPGPQYESFSKSLLREQARSLGVTYGGYTGDYTDATYSSVRMEIGGVWPIVVRRRDRLVAPHVQAAYEHGLEEEIASGRIPFKGGYRAFQANRQQVLYASWQGPPKPTADDLKSAKAQGARIDARTSSVQLECADNGTDFEELFAMQLAEHQRYRDAGMKSPYDELIAAGANPDAGNGSAVNG
ncbi:Bacteriophage capsid protein [uncultured Pleomorphomonas sp.]|uniref:Bacteriophage capsid protein n=1 Tax=uncultured Pleomorphomonas sp. TaxID=442121 RepID=A0A212L777_9HYPH|nr:phage portal protein [uncultured Pleomorphomonas sp.]SCM73396.1 Bacteriophage capsid protein [uncultured Pleomorphomonas sp.]